MSLPKKDWKTGREDIENNTLVIASGQYDLKYYKMTQITN